MDNQSLYRSTLRRDRENMEFWSLPLLESAADRRRHKAARDRAIAFTLGSGLTFFAILALAVLI
ncbi:MULTISPECIES: hypothetical protein [unclassified Sphingopyxis]|uniref:hypothetical protein n=1 Tax=unclassified Sphingopyxis TaxID=2614943 RepID=UPI000730A287|nr:MULTISPECIES: hypothetical protein [unclassified Sphingopyxis]KTE24438.1 hypothetical protein ATE61_13610 [Sphingopyxis sp. H057]KTE50966.1 hypothetical protein ATE69_17310 [Sphingopyxis sp. H071]KTE52109.1 hypothetical protein ATE64_11915 [Sphingopyxis sp. H073]KTE60558.1 hypothetical protein ATE66_08230 [Sphingopyxis sp. H107]KTE63853.1 hypothetical protein ATE65_13705 [Sphingopyxis sp. H100]